MGEICLKKHVFLISFCFLFFLAGTAIAGPQYITISTASMGGPSYATGNAFANHLNHTALAKEYKFSAIEGGGSSKNIMAISNQEVELATIRGGVAYDAFNSKGNYSEKAPASSLRALFAMWPSAIQIVSLQKYSDINSIPDLKDKTMDVGERNNARELVFRSIMETYGINYWERRDLKASYIGYAEGSSMLKDGKIVAFVASGLPPIAKIAEADAMMKIKLIPIDEKNVEELCEKTGYFRPYLIPGGTYSGEQNDVLTISDFQLMVCNEKLPENLAYEMVKEIDENLEQFQKTHAAFKTFRMTDGATKCTIPLHPGAKKYFREKGYIQ